MIPLIAQQNFYPNSVLLDTPRETLYNIAKFSSLTSQFTPDLVAIYTDGLTVPRHTQHCDGQWLIIDNYYRVSFKLLCHVVHMRLPTSNIISQMTCDQTHLIVLRPPHRRRMRIVLSRCDVAWNF